MAKWSIPITVIEYEREAIIEADTRKDAIKKLRLGQWEELTDPGRFKVTKVGFTRRLHDRVDQVNK